MSLTFDRELANSEMLKHFRNLIKINTTNPPGNELEAVKYIANVFKQEGIPYQILEPVKGRTSIVARINGDGSKKPLLLMSHLDVVGVEEGKWSIPPFAAEINDNYLWGRGTLDCKNTVSLWLMIILLLKRSNLRFKRDVIFLAAADEETGGKLGAKWIVEKHFELVDAEIALNEGGGFGVEFAGKTFFTYQTAEKGNLWLKLTSQGEPGHASIPKSNNPVLQITNLIQKLQKIRLPFHVTETVKEMIAIMAKTQIFPMNHLMKLILNPLLSNFIIDNAINNELAASSFRAMLRNTLCPTVLKGGHKVNVIPSEASTEIDVRVLPGVEVEKIYSMLKENIDKRIGIEVTDLVYPNESILNHPMADLITDNIVRRFPSAAVIPILSPGSSDSAFFRSRGMVVYGFSPMLPKENASLAHAHDERISLDSINFSLEISAEIVFSFIG